MTLWNKVSSGFDAEDETVNFGARTVAESYDSVYETTTLATIQADGEVVNDPKIIASIHDSILCVTIDKSITIFTDTSCQEIKLCIGFDSLITSYHISKDYYFVFVALINGTFYCLNLEAGGRLVFFRNIIRSYKESGEVIIKVFSEEAGHDASDLLLVTSKGHIHKIFGFNPKVMEAVLDEEDIGKLGELTKSIQCCLLFEEQRIQQAACAEVNILYQKQSVVMIGKEIYIWPSQQFCTLNFSPYEYTKIQYFKNSRFLLCLRTDGALNIVCSATLIAKKVWDGLASDIVIVEDEADSAPQILILLKPKEGSSTTFVQLVSFPDFEVKFNLQVSTTTYLVNLDGGSIDEIVFLEGARATSIAIDTVKVKAIGENLPECRLQRLLKRGKYEEAEIFAKRFNLSTDTIYCAKAASLTQKFNSSTNDGNVSDRLNELIETLDKIKDVELVLQYCHNTVTSDIQESRRLVCYARERLVKDAKKTNDDLIATHLLNLNNTLLKIETYEMIQIIKENTDTSKNEDNINNWIEFSCSDLLKECRNYLIYGELKVAALIWVRHSSSLLPRITTHIVKDMLEIIPADLLQQDLSPWLFHFVPSLLSVFPNGLSEIVIWGYKRAKSFEKFDQKNWPQSGLDFCKSLMKLLNFEESESSFHLQQQYTTMHSPLQHFTAVIQALTDLQYLKTNYRLIVKIDAYMGEPIKVAHLLLHKIYTPKVSNFVANFLHQYMLNHSLKNDHVLILYIQKKLKKSEGWWFWEGAPWEQKIASIIGCIHNVESRLQQTLDTLRKASVPWSPTMQALAETSISSNHPLVSAIITERNSVATKLILKKYGFQHIGITDTLIKYIIKENREEMLEDLDELTKSNRSLKTQAISICVNFFLNKGDLKQTITVIKSQPDEDAIYCCKQIINYIIACLHFKEMNNDPDYYTELIGVVQIKLKSLLLSSSNTGTSKCDDILATASELKSICLLRKEFAMNLTVIEYKTEGEIVLRNHLKILCNDLGNKKSSAFTIYKRAGRMADLLKLPQILAVCFLLENTRNIEILKCYIERIQGMGSFPAEECPYVKRLCHICILDLKMEESKALSSLKNVSASALNSCSIEELSQILLTTIWTHLNCKITENEAMNGTDLRNGISDTMKWRLHNIYTDPTMCSSQMILSFFIKSFKLHSSFTDQKAPFKGDTNFARENSSEQLIDLISEVKAIRNENYDFPLLQIINNLGSSCFFITTASDEIVSTMHSVREKCLRMLLKKIISARIFDLQSGLSCISMLSEQDAFKWLISACKMYQTDYSRLRVISDLGYEYCCLIKNKSNLNYFAYYRVCHYWARKLSDYGIHHKEIIFSNTEGKQDILERLMRSNKSGFIDLLKEFCKDFEFDFDECYILYLDILLKQWNPTIKVVTLNSEEGLKINQDEIDALYKTCKEVAALIEDKSAMRKHLANLWTKINFYHYEVFLLIMELLEDKSETRLNHFYFLQNYLRFGSPTQIEYEEWSQVSPENNSLPAISKWRLPFLPKVDQWKLIGPELNLSTYEKWMEIAQILNLQIHLICTLAIKGSVNQVWGSNSELNKRNSNQWLIHSKNSALLEDIKACIQRMPDHDALYYGTAVLYYVVNHTPPGADQAAAARECYANAQKWAQASVQSDEAMIKKIEYKYLQLTAKHILYTHGLGNEHYLQLAVSPERLVRKLYMDESIVLRSRGATEHRPDINSAVNAIGKIFSLNVIQLRLELLEEWLQPTDDNSKLDDSITYNIVTASYATEDNAIDDDNLLRACYILEWGDKIMSANYLINIGFGTNNEASFRPGIQFRALHVLLSITDSATVQDLTKRDLQSIKQYMKSLQYVSKLERLGLTFNVHRFESCSKIELAQALAKIHLPQAIILILQMCIDFELKSYTLWDETLSEMAKMCMVKELGKFLPKVAAASHAVGCNGYIRGWEVLLWEPFRKTDAIITQEQFDDCLASICSLHSCPVARKLNLKPIIETCFQSHHPELAAALLPFLNKNDSDFVLKTIGSSYKIPKVIEDLHALSMRQILTISYSIRILEESLQSNMAKNG